MAITIGGGITLGGGISFIPGPPADPYWSSTTMLLPGNGTNGANNNTFVDSSGNNVSITRSGSTTQGTRNPFSSAAPYSAAANGGSAYFNGSTDYLTAPASSNFDFGTGDFTIESWFYLAGNSSAQGSGSREAVLFSNDDDINGGGVVSGSICLTIAGDASTTGVGILFYRRQTSGAYAEEFFYGTAIAQNTWNHVAVVKSGSNIKIFFNGSIGLSTTAVNTTWGTSAKPSSIGGRYITNYRSYINGYISNLRVVKGTAVYTSAFTPSTTPLTAVSGTSLLLSGTNAAVIDNTMNTNLTTVDNASISTAQSKFGGSSMYFYGSAGSNPTTRIRSFGSSNNLNAGDFTVEMWYYPTAHNTTGYPVLYTDYETWVGGAGYNGLVALLAGNKDRGAGNINKVYLSLGDNYWFGTTTVPPLNTWTHIALVRNGNRFMVFINGIMEVDTTQAVGALTSNQLAVVGGGIDAGGLNCITGYIDDFRLTKYARYTSNFSVPTEAFPIQG